MLTKKDIGLLKKHFTTKEDLKKELSKFATRDDLKNLATKDDLKRFATKDDLKEYAKKDDLRGLIDEMIEYINTSAEVTKNETIREIRLAIREEISPILQNHELRIRNLEKDHEQN